MRSCELQLRLVVDKYFLNKTLSSNRYICLAPMALHWDSVYWLPNIMGKSIIFLLIKKRKTSLKAWRHFRTNVIKFRFCFLKMRAFEMLWVGLWECRQEKTPCELRAMCTILLHYFRGSEFPRFYFYFLTLAVLGLRYDGLFLFA